MTTWGSIKSRRLLACLDIPSPRKAVIFAWPSGPAWSGLCRRALRFMSMMRKFRKIKMDPILPAVSLTCHVENAPRRRAIIVRMKSVRSTKQKHEVPWTLVASGKRATPRLVLVSRLDASPQRSKPNHRVESVDTSQVGRRLERAFIHAVKTAKRNAQKA